MQALLTNIELDIQELKYLMDAFSREPNASLRELLKRNILQMRARLDQLLSDLDAVSQPNAVISEFPITPMRESMEEQLAFELNSEELLDENILLEIKAQSDVVCQPEMESESQMEIELKETVSAISTPILGERIKPVTDLRRSISLNDSFRFSRELFNGDSEQMNRAIEQISEMSSLEAATAFLLSKVSVGEENEAMADFMELLKKYFD